MDYGFFKAFEQLLADIAVIKADVAEIKVMCTALGIDPAAVASAAKRLKVSGDALKAAVEANPAPAP